MKNTEIERKWMMEGFPQGLPLLFEARMEQGYLAFEPTTVRIRKTTGAQGTNCKLTCKSKGTLQRTEVEFPITEEQYTALSSLLAAPTARKHFRTYSLPGGEVLECSIVDEGEATCFAYAEVEFETVEQARAFTPHPALGREVTEEAGYSMAAYCRNKQQVYQNMQARQT